MADHLEVTGTIVKQRSIRSHDVNLTPTAVLYIKKKISCEIRKKQRGRSKSAKMETSKQKPLRVISVQKSLTGLKRKYFSHEKMEESYRIGAYSKGETDT